jgi:hypothetical protein
MRGFGSTCRGGAHVLEKKIVPRRVVDMVKATI